MAVTPGELYKEVPWEQKRQEKQEFRLREKMIKKKHKNLYKSMMAGKKDRAKEIWLLRKKRRLLDAQTKEDNKAKKKQQKLDEMSETVPPTKKPNAKKGKNIVSPNNQNITKKKGGKKAKLQSA